MPRAVGIERRVTKPQLVETREVSEFLTSSFLPPEEEW